MPIYEYTCNKCKEEFSLFKWKEDGVTSCPKCGSKDVKKKFSAFACPLPAGSSGSSHNPFSGGG